MATQDSSELDDEARAAQLGQLLTEAVLLFVPGPKLPNLAGISKKLGKAAEKAAKGKVQYKTKKSKISGKEGAKDPPDWAQGKQPSVGESGKDFAKRLMDEKYGPKNHDTHPGSEFSQIKKWADRSFE